MLGQLSSNLQVSPPVDSFVHRDEPKTELGNYEPVYTTELIENNWPAGYARLETRSGHKSLIIRRIKEERMRIMTSISWCT